MNTQQQVGAKWISHLRAQLAAQPAEEEHHAQVEMFDLEAPAEVYEFKSPMRVIEMHLLTAKRVCMELLRGSERLDYFAIMDGLKLKAGQLLLWKATTTVHFTRIQRSCTLLQLEEITGCPWYTVIAPVYGTKTVVRNTGLKKLRENGWEEKSLLRRSVKTLERNGFCPQGIRMIQAVKAYRKK